MLLECEQRRRRRVTPDREENADARQASSDRYGADKRYVRRDEQGRFQEVEDVGRSLAADQRRKAKTAARLGQGDKGDRARKS
ncbi:hypothetical protein [Roseococcus sp. SYP-B2431]|uniref:hypothetical protein n=1 Tax=Roseococcus sp. SYP-B2431 TaxID=2496640 RepID=UPI00197FE77C|nr:hypothetical protein [Roseococcus sp. SYP-B2431]